MISTVQTLRASAAQGAGTVTGDAGNGGLYKLQQRFDELVAQLVVSAAATEVSDTLDVYIDTSFDGGTTFVNIGHFTQVLGNGGAKTFVLVIKNDNPGASAVFDVTSNAAAGATRQIGFGDRVRFRSVVADGGGAAASFTHEIKVFLK